MNRIINDLVRVGAFESCSPIKLRIEEVLLFVVLDLGEKSIALQIEFIFFDPCLPGLAIFVPLKSFKMSLFDMLEVIVSEVVGYLTPLLYLLQPAPSRLNILRFLVQWIFRSCEIAFVTRIVVFLVGTDQLVHLFIRF